MSMSTRLDPAGFAKAMLLVSSDIPADMTLSQWRREKIAAVQMSRPRRRRVIRILRRRRGL
jgi:hypothetical protein